MERSTLEQQIEIAFGRFPVGAKVCNHILGRIGTVTGSPFADIARNRIFVPVTYNEDECFDDINTIFVVVAVRKGKKRA